MRRVARHDLREEFSLIQITGNHSKAVRAGVAVERRRGRRRDLNDVPFVVHLRGGETRVAVRVPDHCKNRCVGGETLRGREGVLRGCAGEPVDHAELQPPSVYSAAGVQIIGRHDRAAQTIRVEYHSDTQRRPLAAGKEQQKA